MAASGMVINIVLNVILIPQFKANGSAMVSLITQFIIAVTQVLLVQRLFKFKINYRFIISIALFIIGVIIINWISVHYYYTKQNWLVSFIGMVVACFIYAFALRILSVKSIYNILQTR